MRDPVLRQLLRLLELLREREASLVERARISRAIEDRTRLNNRERGLCK